MNEKSARSAGGAGVEDQRVAKVTESAPPALGKYAPFARLGHGGMADVFLAVARGPVGFNKLAVVKRLRRPDESAQLEMFLDEARLSARLSHPNIVNTYEVGEAKGQYFIAMEYLEGQPLQAVLTGSATGAKPDEALAAFIAMQALKGLHYAHELTDYDGTPLHVVHRDVSPHNLFITYQGEVKVLDFGIAKAALNSTHTETGVVKGKVRYMAPEQIVERSIDRRADVFALGIVLWEMLAGRRLHTGDLTAVLKRVTTQDAPPLRSVREEISPELEAIVEKALQRDLDKRYATADAMRADLERFLQGKPDGADVALARLVNDGFAQTRDAIRSRIKTFLAQFPTRAADSPSAPDLVQAAELLPALFGDGSGGGGTDPTPSLKLSLASTSLASTKSGVSIPSRGPSEAMPIAPRRSRAWLWATGGVGLVVLAIGALRAKPPVDVAPAAAAQPAPVAVRPSTAPVHIETSPAGALVEWNGESLARTPTDLTLAAGTQTLVVSRDGYEPERVTIEVQADVPVARAVALRAKIAPVPTVIAPRTTGAARQWAPAAPAAAPPAATASATSAARPKIRVVDDTEAP
jgi:serine/threonine protein kinase